MGREIRCRIRHDGQEAVAKAQLETDELIVRSPFRLTVPRAGIRSATVAGEALEVVYDSTISEPMLRQLAERLPGLVSEAVACPEELHVGPPEPGDLEIRFRPKGPFDVGELSCAIEVRTKLYASRLETRQSRAELIKASLSEAVPGIRHMGVWLVLADGWWTQT
jgi:hypothetical protein